MDIFSHGLWAGAAYKVINIKKKKNFNVWWASFWGIFPDLFAFTIPFLWLVYHWLVGDLNLSMIPRPEHAEPIITDSIPVFRLASSLYNLSHSLIIFLIVSGIIYLVLRRQIWELGGWLLHILIDVPTHTYRFFPTPIFWPLSGWKFDGISWGTPWFLITNYSLLAVVYILLWLYKRKFKLK